MWPVKQSAFQVYELFFLDELFFHCKSWSFVGISCSQGQPVFKAGEVGFLQEVFVATDSQFFKVVISPYSQRSCRDTS